MVYHYDGSGHLIAETTPAGAPLRSYVWRDDVAVAQIEHQQNGAIPRSQIIRVPPANSGRCQALAL